MKVVILLCVLGACMCTQQFVICQDVKTLTVTGSAPVDFLKGILKGITTKFGFAYFPQANEAFHVAKLEFERMVEHFKGGNTTEALWYGWHAFNQILDGVFDYCGAIQTMKNDLDEFVNMVDGHMSWDAIKQHFLISFFLNAQEAIGAIQDAVANVKAGDWYKLGFDVGVLVMDVAFNQQGF